MVNDMILVVCDKDMKFNFIFGHGVTLYMVVCHDHYFFVLMRMCCRIYFEQIWVGSYVFDTGIYTKIYTISARVHHLLRICKFIRVAALVIIWVHSPALKNFFGLTLAFSKLLMAFILIICSGLN